MGGRERAGARTKDTAAAAAAAAARAGAWGGDRGCGSDRYMMSRGRDNKRDGTAGAAVMINSRRGRRRTAVAEEKGRGKERGRAGAKKKTAGKRGCGAARKCAATRLATHAQSPACVYPSCPPQNVVPIRRSVTRPVENP